MKLEANELEIRPASKKELYSITVMTRKFFPYTKFSMDVILKRLKTRRIFYYVALYRGHTVGFIDFKENAKSVKLMGLAVLEEFRGQGVGKRLLQVVLDFAKAKKKREIILLVAEGNEPGLSLYEKFGFRRKGKLAVKIWNQDVLLYVLPLQPRAPLGKKADPRRRRSEKAS